MNLKKYSMIIICSLFLIFNCTVSNNGNNGNKNTNDEKPFQTPVITTLFKPDANGQIVFQTNDPAFIDPVYGATVWIWGNILKPAMAVGDVFEITVSKESGKSGYGYGLIFCVQGNTYNFLTVLIDNSGEYCICKCTGPNSDGGLDDAYIQNWTPCNDISKGQGASNDIKITYMGKDCGNGNEKFDLEFNNSGNIITFEYNNSTTPVFTMTGRYGYIAVLAPDENFPNVPVIIKYNQLYPASISLPSLSLMNKDLKFSTAGNNGINIYKKSLFRKN